MSGVSERGGVLLTGASGFLGAFVARELSRRGIAFVTGGRSARDRVALDLARPDDVRRQVEELRPGIVLAVAALSRMGDCDADPTRADVVNSAAVAALAAGTERLVQVSTDLVFDGREAPYASTAATAPAPTSAYGRSKLAGERAALAVPGSAVVRLPLLFGRSDDGTRGATDMLRSALADDCELRLFTNEFRTPLAVADAARALVDVAFDADRTGVVHVAGPERLDRCAFAARWLAAHGRRWPDGRWWATECVDPVRPRDVSMLSDWSAGRSLDAMLADA